MKTTKQVLAILLTVLMVLSFSSAAFAEGETWVPIKTSGDTLEKGDLYVDLASVKDAYLEREIYQSFVGQVHPKDAHWNAGADPDGTFNNYEIAALEKLAGLYPALWEASVQESYEADPTWGIDGFYTIQDAWNIFFDNIKTEHPELGFTDWSSLAPFGYAYLCEEYPETLETVSADAEAAFTVFEEAEWSYDSSFTNRWNWLKAESDGEEIPMIPEEIKESFNEYGIDWQPVAADIASVEGEGGYYLNGNGIEATLSEEEKESFRQQGEWTYEMYKDRLPTTLWISFDETVEVTTEDELRAAIDAMVESQISMQEARLAEYYGTFFEGVTLLVNPDPDSMFQISFTKTYEDFGGSFEQTSFYPFAELRGANMPVTTEQLWDCVNAYRWAWNGEAASVTVTTGLGEEIETVAADVSFETTTEPQVGVDGEKLATATATVNVNVNDTELTATKSFEVPALDPPEEPSEPTSEPATEPTGDKLCPWDQVDHGTSFWGKLVRLIHGILYFFAHLFGLR